MMTMWLAFLVSQRSQPKQNGPFVTVICRWGLPSLKLTAKAPENGWLEDKPFLLGPGLFSGAFAVSFREGTLSPIIMEVENGKSFWKVTILWEIHPFLTEPWVWEEGCRSKVVAPWQEVGQEQSSSSCYRNTSENDNDHCGDWTGHISLNTGNSYDRNKRWEHYIWPNYNISPTWISLK